MKRFTSIGVLCLASLSLFASRVISQNRSVSLEGEWELRYPTEESAPRYVYLPGSFLTNGAGDVPCVTTPWTATIYDSSFYFNPFMARYREPGKVKFPFFLTPESHYVGMAWYHRKVYIPRSFMGCRVILFLERPHIETTVYVGGRKVGHETSLSTPHEYDITEYARCGAKNDIVILVDNRTGNVDVGQDSHSVTDQTQGNWNGITGRMEIYAASLSLSIGNVQVYASPSEKKVHAEVEVNGSPADIMLMKAWVTRLDSQKALASVTREVSEGVVAFALEVGDSIERWNEFHPALYRLYVSLGGEETSVTFGWRDITAEGRQLLLDGKPLFLRGTVESCVFPLTGYPPTDPDSWTALMRKAKRYGINLIRFHSWCPPEAAFDAADIVGMYLHVELPSWPNHGVRLGVGQPVDTYLDEESERIIRAYGNHPSFIILAGGNEPAGQWVRWGQRWARKWKGVDPRRLYSIASVGGSWQWDEGSEVHIKGGARGLDWEKKAPESSDDFREQIAVSGEPWITHELGQWCAFPDLSERSQYTGVYHAYNYDIFADLLKENGMEDMAQKFLDASGKLQTLCYKYDIERNLRTPDFAGFEMLALNDYPGQGTATVGALNVFWREKGYTCPAEWRQFCSPVVPLARFPRFVYENKDTLTVPVEIMNASDSVIEGAAAVWTITAGGGEAVAEGSFARRDIPLGKNNGLGEITLPLARFVSPGCYTLTVSVGEAGVNSWRFWVYPSYTGEEEPPPPGLLITDSLDGAALTALERGATVLITAAGKVTYGADVCQRYLPVFWNTSWFKMRPPHTTGSYIDRSHPLFREFPTDTWQDINWWEIVNGAEVMNLAEFPKSYQPPVQPIDTWHVSRKLAMIIEARVISGRLLMTTIDISGDLARRPVARQMRRAIIDYMSSEAFLPSLTLDPKVISHLFTLSAPSVNMFTRDSPDELKPGGGK